MKRFYHNHLHLLLLFLSTTAFGQQARLSYDLHPGEIYMLDVDLQQNTRSESMDSEEISLSSRTKLEFRVDSLDVLDQIHMTVRYTDLQLSMLAPGMDIDINSENRSNPMLSDMVDLLKMAAFNITVDRKGELKSLEGLEPLFESLASFPVADTNERQVIIKTLEEAFGPDSFRNLAGLFISVYPVVAIMTNWTTDITYYFNTKPVPMVNRYNLSRSTETVHTVQGLGMLNASQPFHERTGMGEVQSMVQGSQTYDFQMDRETGWLKRCVSRQRIMIETTILKSSFLPAGLRIPSYAETLFEVRGSRILQQ